MEALDSLPLEELIGRALESSFDEEETGGDTAHGAWAAVHAMQRRADVPTLNAATGLLRHADPWHRDRGAGILGQLGLARQPFREERLGALLGALEGEPDLRIVRAIGIALGHLNDPRTLPAFRNLATHPNGEARYAAAFGVSADWGDEAVELLIKLTADAEAPVRDWATFAFNQSGADSAAIREALVSRLEDPDEDVRGEAICALARRRDARGLLPLRRALAGGQSGYHYIEAAQLWLGLPLDVNRPADELLAALDGT